jgi:hypothetical protein
MEDLPLLEEGVLQWRDLFTIRKGELVLDNVRGGLTLARQEMIKIREREGKQTGGCLFYEDGEKGCGIYSSRPVQCAALKCWDTADFMEVYQKPKPARTDIITDGVLLELIRGHEERCSYAGLEGLVKQIETQGEEAVERILALMRFDHQIRPFVSEKLGIDPNDMGLVFGRPLTETVSMFGLRVTREEDGAFLLTS